MRITAISAAVALMVLSVSTSLMAQRPDDQIDPKSLALLQEGRAAKAAGNLDGAQDALESALAVDPRNREAFLVLGEIARTRGLPGKAIRLYREALTLEPNDLAALRGQGEALVAKGATARIDPEQLHCLDRTGHAFEALAEHFPALTERGGGQLLERL